MSIDPASFTTSAVGNDKELDANVDIVDADEEVVWTAEDEVISRRAMRKLDLTLVPLFGVIFMMASLDRSNIGNAKVTGYETDLHLVGNQFGAITSVVYATYVIFEPIYSVLLKIVTPRIMLTASVTCWSAVTIGGAFIKNYEQAIATRLLLGLFEAVCAPCIALYLTQTYHRNEYVSRQTAIQAMSALSGAFGGLLAYGLYQIQTTSLHGWRWMYIVEGLISACLVPLTWFVLPNRPVELRWLNDREREAFLKRAILNRKYYDDRDTFSWYQIRRAYKDWRLYVHAINHFGIDCTLYSLTTFLPSLCSGLGFTTTVGSNLLTVPVYAVAALAFVGAGLLSDKYMLRSPFILFGLGCNLVGYIILATAPQVGVRYAGIFISAIGLYIPTALNNLWAADNTAPHFKRAATCGSIVLVGNTAGAVIGFVFTSQTAPRYFKGIYFVIAFTSLSLIMTTVLFVGNRQKNAAKARAIADGAADDRSLGDANPHYKLVL